MFPEHKWEIGVSAGNYYPSLTQSFWGNDIGLSYEDDHLGMQFFAYSYHIDELDDKEDVASRLFTLQLLLNGCLRVAWNRVHPCPVEFTGFARCGGGTSHSVYASRIEDSPFSTDLRIDQEEHRHFPAKGRLESYLLNLCKRDLTLRSLILQVGLISLGTPFQQIMTWSTLYKMYDTVNYQSRIHKYSLDSFADKEKISAFNAACNNWGLLGVYARHGEKGWEIPNSAITDLNEAVDVILGLTSRFCRHYVEENYP